MKKNIILFCAIICFLIPFSLSAQESYEEWLKKDRQQYREYLSEQDKAFMDFLKADWEAFQSFKGIKPDTTPKPPDTPVAPDVKPPEPKPDAAPPEPVELPSIPDEPIPEKPDLPTPPEPKQQPESAEPDVPPSVPEQEPGPVEPEEMPPMEPEPEPEPPEPEPVQSVQPAIDVPFYETTVNVPSPESINLSLKRPISNESIADAWESMARADLQPTLDHLNAASERMQLNDWGFLRLAQSYSEILFPGNTSKQLVLDWFITNKSGYKVKLSYQGNTILLLLPFEQTVYELPYTTIEGQKYYFYGLDKTVDTGKPLYSYKKNYPDADKGLSLSLNTLPDISDNTGKRTLVFNYNNQEIKMDVAYRKDAVAFLADYPQSELDLFLKSRPSFPFQYSLVKALRPVIKGKNELEAVNLLLRFVQTGFEYQTDDQQFGKEKYLLPEETIHYPASDCEDRSILFSYLVKELLGNKVILLDFPGHICTAVQLKTTLNGDSVDYNGANYTVCDPTYINAGAGMLMPNFANVQPEVIEYN